MEQRKKNHTLPDNLDLLTKLLSDPNFLPGWNFVSAPERAEIKLMSNLNDIKGCPLYVYDAVLEWADQKFGMNGDNVYVHWWVFCEAKKNASQPRVGSHFEAGQLFNAQQLYIENQGGKWPDLGTSTPLSVGQVLRNQQNRQNDAGNHVVGQVGPLVAKQPVRQQPLHAHNLSLRGQLCQLGRPRTATAKRQYGLIGRG